MFVVQVKTISNTTLPHPTPPPQELVEEAGGTSMGKFAHVTAAFSDWSILAFSFSLLFTHTPLQTTAIIVAALVGVFTLLEEVTVLRLNSAIVACLFISFLALTVPAALSAGGGVGAIAIAIDTPLAVSTALPIILLTGLFQNIVPKVTSNLNFERKNIIPTLAIGSSLPQLMYLTFIHLTNTGSLPDPEAGNPFLTSFILLSTLGSIFSCTFSLSNELKDEFNLFTESNNSNNNNKRIPILPLLLAILPPIVFSLAAGSGNNEGVLYALKQTGAITPVLYRVLPAVICHKIKLKCPTGGNLGLALLGGSSSLLFMSDFVK